MPLFTGNIHDKCAVKVDPAREIEGYRVQNERCVHGQLIHGFSLASQLAASSL